MPVAADFHKTFQWVRELRRSHSGRLCGVYFRIDDREPVLLGRYNRDHRRMAAAETLREIDEDDADGLQVLIPRRISPKEIRRIKSVPQIIGWRYFPEAKGRRPCGCPACQYGLYGSRKLRKRYDEEEY